MLRSVELQGELDGLKLEGQFVWDAIKLECVDTDDNTIGEVDLISTKGTYTLPPGTVKVKLWIGQALGDWWKEWDCQPADTAQNPIILQVVRRGAEKEPPPKVPPK